MEERYSVETRIHCSKLLLAFIKWIIIGFVSLVVLFFITHNVDLNVHVSLKEWLSPVKVKQEPLVCTIETTTQQSTVIIPSAFEHNTCFEFAFLIPTNKTPPVTTTFHTFWKGREFSKQQLNAVRSFLHTQPTSNLIVWVFDEESLKKSKRWQSITTNRVRHQTITDDLIKEIPGTELTENVIRLATLYQYGGVWFDLNVLFVRDLSPLLDQEWMSQGNCQEAKPYRFTGSMMHFFKHSHYLCEILSSGRPSFDLYSRIYDRYLGHNLKPWTILPWCYTDPAQCNTGHPGTKFDKDKLSSIFVYHLRPSWWSFTYGSIYKNLTKSLDD
ncbi:hypothetical protein G6F56_004908 [Rhizopus delemar]|uniref:Uncharacterized protein n=1 Tax=Rhizopus stolonifer TaxID=4846 RepID=A0A367KLL5_RHIST|nr:hypothetical protein G6F56_004908 [Rhizopus delemar]RCI03041.1 hypothetical protein CU098_011381 [Rhizopus stolonifer]